MIVASVLVAVLAVGGLVTALVLNNGDDKDPKAGGGSASASVKPEGYRGPDTSKTIEPEKCEEPQESYNDPELIRLPNFKFKHIASVKACFQAMRLGQQAQDRHGRREHLRRGFGPRAVPAVARTSTRRTCRRSPSRSRRATRPPPDTRNIRKGPGIRAGPLLL